MIRRLHFDNKNHQRNTDHDFFIDLFGKSYRNYKIIFVRTNGPFILPLIARTHLNEKENLSCQEETLIRHQGKDKRRGIG